MLANIEIWATGVVLVRRHGNCLKVRVYDQASALRNDKSLSAKEREMVQERFLGRHRMALGMAKCGPCGDAETDGRAHLHNAVAATGTTDPCAYAATVITVTGGGTTFACDPPYCDHGTCEPRTQEFAGGSATPECYCNPQPALAEQLPEPAVMDEALANGTNTPQRKQQRNHRRLVERS